MQNISSILTCPACRSTEFKTSPPECPACGRKYAQDHGFLNLTPVPPPDADVLEKWDLWEKLQANGLAAYDDAPDESLSVGKRRDAQAYGKFCRLEGCLTLDIGCGPQRMPSYGIRQERNFVGIDPLPSSGQRAFHFVQAIAEYLPFRDGVFDRVLFATSLDHVLNPPRALREARRTLKPEGHLCIWYGDDDLGDQPAAHKRTLGSMWRNVLEAWKKRGVKGVWKRVLRKLGMARPPMTDKLRVPEGAVDHYHFFHVEMEHLEAWLKEAGFRVVEVSREGGPGSVFVRAVLA